MSASTYVRRFVQSNLARIYLPAALCFFVINVTNIKILQILRTVGVIYGTDPDMAVNAEKTAKFFLIPAKSFLFFACTAILIVPLAAGLAGRMGRLIQWRHIVQTLQSLALSLLLICTIMPTSFGRSYARISIDPFAQNVDQLYRRLLVPGLANLYHLDGFLYTFFFWAIVFLTALMVRYYFLTKGLELPVWQEVSLLTVGIFASSFQVPGYPEIAVLLLGLVALIEFDHDGLVSAKQIAAFALALMAHEACAVIVFVPMMLFFFGRRSWLPYGILAGMYLGMMLLNFSFDLSVPFHLQARVSDTPSRVFFVQYPWTVVMGIAFAFKLMWIILGAGIYYQFKSGARMACYTLFAIVLACASTYIAVDYTRLVGFASIPLILCFRQAREKMPAPLFRAMVLLNIVVPSLYVGGNCGIVTCRGLYYLAYRLIFRLPAPAL